MKTLMHLITRIERRAAQHGIAPSTFCARAVNDGKCFSRLKAGRTIRVDTLEKLEAALKAPLRQYRPAPTRGAAG